MKLELTMFADDVTALVEALTALVDKVQNGSTIGGGATSEWAYNFYLHSNDIVAQSWVERSTYEN